MKKVIIVGAGASGLVAAIYAAKNGNEVTLLEKNSSAGKKILITGNGKCNYFNEDNNLKHYYSSDKQIVSNIINEQNLKEISSFFDSIGIIPKIKNGYYYPSSGLSATVKESLLKECELLNVNIITDYEVNDIKWNDKFIINGKLEADSLVIATGGLAAPKTGSTGDGYKFAQIFGHLVIKTGPSLVKLKGEESYFKDWDKIRCDAKVSLVKDEKVIKEETGELQLTKDGISGVCVFNLSSEVSAILEEKNTAQIMINFIPWLQGDIDYVLNYLSARSEMVTGRNILEFLEGMLHYKIVKIILKKSGINAEKYYEELTKKEKYNLIKNLISFKLNIKTLGTFEEAQVTKGGVPLREIDENMQSRKKENLYLVGELLDVNGDCGGYNLTFAFISGMLAGKDIK